MMRRASESSLLLVGKRRAPTTTLSPDPGPGAPVVLCLHGFPDTHDGFFTRLGGAPSFADHLVAKGYRVVAPAMRGTHEDALSPDGDYSPLSLAQDVIDTARALGGRVAVVGNDWGALLAYLAAVESPELFTHLVALAIPHPLAIKWTPKMVWRARHFIGFQLQKRSARWLRKDELSGVDALYRRWSPTWDFPPEALAAVKKAYSAPGVVEGALAPYAAMRRDNKKIQARLKQKIEVPTFAIGGGDDPTVPKSAYAASARGFGKGYGFDFVPGVGHFPHREDPAAVAERVLAFLAT